MRSMNRFVALTFAVSLALAGGVATATSAFAAAPGNDNSTGAIVISTVPSTVNQDTTEATTSAEETALNGSCGAPVVGHGVWYTFTATADEYVAVDVTGSDYSAGVMVATGSPGGLTLSNCGPGRVVGPVTTGTTYYLLIFGDGSSTATSGNMVLQTSVVAPPPNVSLTVDPRGTVDKFGNANISGTVTCTSTDGSGQVFDIFGSLRQTVGRVFIDGSFDTFTGSTCNGTAVSWSAIVIGTNGKFAGGKAATVAVGFGCTDGGCSEGFVQSTIQLSKARGR